MRSERRRKITSDKNTQITKTPDRDSHKTKSWYEIKTVTKRVIIESDERQSEWHVQEVSDVFLFFHST